MPLVSVTKEYLAVLAQHQREAAATFAEAASAVSGLAHRVWHTHGAICESHEARHCLRNVEDAHNRLAYGMQKYANDLADWLTQAAYAYESTDDIAAQNMRRQIM